MKFDEITKDGDRYFGIDDGINESLSESNLMNNGSN
jgi:hypothetical protein